MVPYGSPAALRAAVKDKLSAMAAAHPHRPVPQLQRQFAYDRLLARVFSAEDAESWVLKGAGALLARLPEARHSADIDLYRCRDALPAAEQALRSAADADLGDYFAFELSTSRALEQAGSVRRIGVTARIGAGEYASFHVDLVAHLIMTGRPDQTSALVDIDLPGLLQPPYLVYPLADHIADKVAAIHETHRGRSSTRVKDLVDLVLIATTQRIDAVELCTAVRSEAARRGLALPATFAVPGTPVWATAYRRLAASSPGMAGYPALADAVALMRVLIDPILGGSAVGGWDPESLRWVSRGGGRG